MNVYKLKNKAGMEVSFLAIGGKITKLRVPNGEKRLDVVIGYDTAEEAIKGESYFGALCGRFSNRIVAGKFSLNGTDYQLDCNDGKNHLHGGFNGFDRREWAVEHYEDKRFEQAYKLSLVSADGEEGYPGTLKVAVIYGLASDNALHIEYKASTDKPTIINLTSHAYFNLNGASSGSIEQHKLQLDAAHYNPLSAELATVSGEIAPVAGTPMDFTSPKTFDEAFKMGGDQIEQVAGIDHNFVIDDCTGSLKQIGTLTSEASGLSMEIYTDQPGVQIYTGGHFNGTDIGKDGKGIPKWAGVAIETQNFPNSPNVEAFPSPVLNPGETYKHTCIYKFK